jgi:outer membrane protein assembly factor BamD
MNKGFFHTVAFIALLLIAAGCSNFQKVLKSNNVDQKYKAALDYYEKEDYYRANLLLEQVLPLLSGQEEAEKAKFYFANTYYQQGDYLLSAFHFKNFYETYPRSPLAEEAMFMYARSNYNSSPSFEQDQTSTVAAIEALQEFAVRYPESERLGEVNKMIDDLNAKLDRKAFEHAQLYYKILQYRSAVVALTNFLQEHPASAYSEEAAFLRIDAQYQFAEQSITSKQQERYYEAIEYYQVFIDQYPKSEYLRKAEQIYTDALAKIEQLKKTDQKNS